MSARVDIVVVGAGHNGLAAAAYLARTGKSVLVLERAATVGGTAQTREFAPGFRASAGFQTAETLSPKVVSELRLASHGLVLSAAGGTALAHRDGWLMFDGRGRPSSAGGSSLSAADKESLRLLERFVGRVVNALAPLYNAPLPPLEDLGTGDKLDLLRVGLRLRRLGRRDMQAAMRFVPMSMRDVVEERFEDGGLRALVAGLGLQGGWMGPYAAGTAFRALHDQIPNPRPLLAGPTFVRGGLGALAGALATSARTSGAEIRLESEVARIESERGRARGVTLVSGEQVEAGVVVSDADPRRTLLSLIDPAALAPEFITAAGNIRARGGVALVTFALEGLPRVPDSSGDGREMLSGRIQIGGSVRELERAFDAASSGSLPERPAVQLLFPSLTDPELAPPDCHVAAAWVQAVPRRLAEHGDEDDGWGAGRDHLGDATLGVIEEVLPDFGAHVVARDVAAPPDFDARFAATDGCLFDADLGLDQALYLRPLPGWSGYRTPISGVYLCGSGSHGGGGITGLAGRNAARRVLEDIKAGRTGRSG